MRVSTIAVEQRLADSASSHAKISSTQAAHMSTLLLEAEELMTSFMVYKNVEVQGELGS